MTTLNFTSLGGFRLSSGTGKELSLSAKKARALFAYLVAHQSEDLPRDRLAGCNLANERETGVQNGVR